MIRLLYDLRFLLMVGDGRNIKWYYWRDLKSVYLGQTEYEENQMIIALYLYQAYHSNRHQRVA